MLGYRVLFASKCVAALSLFAGFAVSGALLILLVEFWIELRIYFKFHTCFFLLIAFCLFLSPDAAHRFTVPGWIESGMSVSAYARAELRSSGDLFPGFLIGLTLIFMYFTTAVRKLHSDFLSGRTIYGTLAVTYLSRTQRLHWDGWYPRAFLKYFILANAEVLQRRWCLFTHLTVAIEFALPVLLLYPPTSFFAVCLGVLLHLAFTLLYPAILAHFSLVTVACYLFLLDPNVVAELFT